MIFLPLDVFLRSVNSLSNSAAASSTAGELLCRIAGKAEMVPAMGWVLGRPLQPASESFVMDFLRLAFRRGIDPAQLWIAARGEEMVWAILPVVSPGRTLLLFAPADYTTELQVHAARLLTQKILEHYSGVLIAQVLLDPPDEKMIELFTALDFVRLAELIYLQNTPRKGYAFPILPAKNRLISYSEETHAVFAATILQTYAQSLDCPGLSGMRNIEDVIIGHKAVGQFDPQCWTVMLEDDIPVGVALLNPLPANQNVELVYLGVVPAARHRGIGQFLFRHALAVTARSEFPRLNFAVDSGNRPALSLYYRHGMERIGSKIAMLRDLRK
jgi:GNAT superfamily N-acetyltransferase